jgi:hypothetical protein
MNRLRELALALPRPGSAWEERPRFAPPAFPESVAKFEQAAGFSLPTDFRQFLASAGAVVGMSIHNGYWLGDVERLALSDFPQSAESEPIVPVATDGGGNAFLISAGGRVWRWTRETGELHLLALSFTDFLARVVADWEAYVTDKPGWRFLV